MSITVRLWSDWELEAIKRCKTQEDKWLATIFMNVKTFSKEDIAYYPYNKRRTYLCQWHEEDNENDSYADWEETIYATDEKMLLRFIDTEYNQRPVAIHQVITQYRPVTV